jgi:hypothetical protein
LTGREEIDRCLQELADRIPTFVFNSLSFSSQPLQPPLFQAQSFTLFHLCSWTFRMPKGMPGLLPLPLHAGLTAEEQQEIFDTPPRDTRKVIVSTNIAEASVTIEGIKYVVDCGFVKVRFSSFSFSLFVIMLKKLSSSSLSTSHLTCLKRSNPAPNIQSNNLLLPPLPRPLLPRLPQSTLRPSRPYLSRQDLPPLPLVRPPFSSTLDRPRDLP